MTIRLAAVGDASALKTLLANARPGLLADFADVSDHTLAQFQGYVANGNIKIVVDAAPMKGCCIFTRQEGSWKLLLVLVSPSLTLLQRLASVRAMFKAVFLAVPGGTMFNGTVRTGRAMDNWLNATFVGPQFTHRVDGLMTFHAGTAADMLAVL
jgi:hypothetical protein